MVLFGGNSVDNLTKRCPCCIMLHEEIIISLRGGETFSNIWGAPDKIYKQFAFFLFISAFLCVFLLFFASHFSMVHASCPPVVHPGLTATCGRKIPFELLRVRLHSYSGLLRQNRHRKFKSRSFWGDEHCKKYHEKELRKSSPNVYFPPPCVRLV